MNRHLPILFAAFAALATAQGPAPKSVAVTAPDWEPSTLAALATLPLQEIGREKPLSSFAATTLYLVHGRRDVKLDTDGDGKPDRTLEPTEWLLDVLLFPQDVSDFPLFRVENVDVFDAIGVPHEGGQSFNFEYLTWRQLITPGKDGKEPVDTLWNLARAYRMKEANDQTPVESHIVRTNEGVNAFAAVLGYFASLRAPYALQGDRLRSLFDGKTQVTFAELLHRGPALAGLVREFRDRTGDPALGNTMAIAGVLTEVAQRHGDLAVFPADGVPKEHAEWSKISSLTEAALRGTVSPTQLALVDKLQAAVDADDMTQLQQRLVEFRDAVVARAEQRGEYSKVELENYYLQASWHYQALHWFLLSILVVALSWTMPRSKWMWWASIASTAVPLAFLVTDVVLRCLVRGRPPILNLYDTFLFIASIGVTAAIVTEVVSRRRIAISLAPLFGALLITLARAFEVESGEDQMKPLQAVLDTNYYLATHVTAINMGYAAGMFASFLGTAWLFLNAIGVRRRDPAFHKAVVRATYGVTAFGLTFAVFGTIYGGVWANDSWGRFWGWDPKENGALLICLAQVALIHARMCGWVRDLGFCVAASAIGLVVAFSWFHVNLLNIGLHSYGFSSATKVALYWYYGIQAGLTALSGFGAWFRLSRATPQHVGTAAPATA